MDENELIEIIVASLNKELDVLLELRKDSKNLREEVIHRYDDRIIEVMENARVEVYEVLFGSKTVTKVNGVTVPHGYARDKKLKEKSDGRDD